MKRVWKTITIAFLLSATLLMGIHAGECPLKNGDKLAFLGDSITESGANKNFGYVNLVMIALKAKGLDVQMIPAGVGGNKSEQMLDRIDSDVLSKGASWMFFSCGVNDVRHGKDGIPLDKYKKLLTILFDKADGAGVKVVILTATMIGEDPKSEHNVQLAAYNDFLREFAKSRGYLLADLNADMQKIVTEAQAKNPKCGNVLTEDGVHMNLAGNKMMASGVLRTLGFTDMEIENIDREHWRNIPGAYTVSFGLSENEYKAAQDAAKKAGKTVNEYSYRLLCPEKKSKYKR